MATPTIDELARRIEALENENQALKNKIERMELLMPGGMSGPMPISTRSLLGNSPPINSQNICNMNDVAGIVGGFIEDFNSKALSGDTPLTYMIGNVDIELKTAIVNDESGPKLAVAEANAAVDNVQTLKFSVKPVPTRIKN